jgi:hypothetical protein
MLTSSKWIDSRTHCTYSQRPHTDVLIVGFLYDKSLERVKRKALLGVKVLHGSYKP